MQGQMLFIGSFIIVIIIIIAITTYFVMKKRHDKLNKEVRALERQTNLIVSTPVLIELSKLETIINNDKMEDKYNKWQERFEDIKKNDISKINNMIIELDTEIEKKDYKSYKYSIAKTEIAIYEAREATNHLLEAIKEVTASEEKYRNIIIKLKTKYRNINNDFVKHQNLYDDMQDAIKLQLENIEKRFLDFEKAMTANEYDEVVHIVKALDIMIEHIEIVVKEVPDLLLMAKQLIPKRIKEINETKEEMTSKGFILDYLNIDYNIGEAEKNINSIMDKIKVLNLEECMFELKTILDYLDSLFVDFEKERLSRKVYEEIDNDFSIKLNKTNKIVEDIYKQLDDIKSMYHLNDDDVKIIDEVNKTLVIINDDYKKTTAQLNAKSSPFSLLHKEVEELTTRLKDVEEKLDTALKSLGNMYEDEQRAKEQLQEIEDFLKQCKIKIRSFKLPIVTNNYFVELNEANEGIEEIIKELSNKPIVIKTLNTRVDTARDLVLKLYSTTNEMIKTAQLAEMAIVYANRYVTTYPEVENGINEASKEFFKGNYKKALDITIKTTSIVDENIYRKMLAIYDD